MTPGVDWRVSENTMTGIASDPLASFFIPPPKDPKREIFYSYNTTCDFVRGKRFVVCLCGALIIKVERSRLSIVSVQKIMSQGAESNAGTNRALSKGDDDGDASGPRLSHERMIAAKEAQVLAELSECVNTLSSLQDVLNDIVGIIEPLKNDQDEKGVNSDSLNQAGGTQKSLPQQMQRLMEELGKWENG